MPDGFNHSLQDAIKAGEKESQEFFNKWTEEVIANVPKERLLIFEAKQGWEPLCKFLDVPVPKDEPYPRINDSAAFKANINKRKRTAYAMVCGIPIVAGVVISWALGFCTF